MGYDPQESRPSIEEMNREPGPVRDMVSWFFDTYEDPDENDSYESAEGGYQFIWGGPYSARDELGSQFPKVDGSHLARAVALIERGGTTEWTKPPDPED